MSKDSDILITDYYCASNRGDAAILEGELEALKQEFPDSDITVMTENPDAAEFIHGIDAVRQVMAPFSFGLSKRNMLRIYLTLLIPFLRLENHSLVPDSVVDRANLEYYFEADLIISTGGTHLTDPYFPGKVGVLWELFFCKMIGKKVVIYGQTLGPFERRPYRPLTRFVLNRLDYVITRDRQSEKLVKELGVSTPIETTADPAFSMSFDIERERAIDYFDCKETSGLEGKCVSLSVRKWSYFSEDSNEEDYIIGIANLADELVDEGFKVVFASTCTGIAGYHKDDRMYPRKIIEEMDNSENVMILSGEYTPQEISEIYGEMEFHIGTRMHSNILALMQKTPVYAIKYQFKTEGMMEMFDIEEYMIDIDEINEDKLLNNVLESLENRDIIQKKIENNLDEVKSESRRSSKIISEKVL